MLFRSVAEKGARKKIHGGSGAVGDGYTPGSTSSPYSSYSYTPSLCATYSRRVPRVPRPARGMDPPGDARPDWRGHTPSVRRAVQQLHSHGRVVQEPWPRVSSAIWSGVRLHALDLMEGDISTSSTCRIGDRSTSEGSVWIQSEEYYHRDLIALEERCYYTYKDILDPGTVMTCWVSSFTGSIRLIELNQ